MPKRKFVARDVTAGGSAILLRKALIDAVDAAYAGAQKCFELVQEMHADMGNGGIRWDPEVLQEPESEDPPLQS